MQTTLLDRVEELVARERRLLTMTPMTAAIGELSKRLETLEQAVREIALEVERLGDARAASLLDESVARRFRRTV